MKPKTTHEIVKSSRDEAIRELIEYHNAMPNDYNSLKLTKEYFRWISLKTRLISNEKSFKIPVEKSLKRGDVYWFEFGYNIGEEFGGKHPAIILRVGGQTAIVAPITSKEPKENQLKSGCYVEVNKIYNFKNLKRWVNVLNIQPISLCRVDFNSNNGNVKGYILDNINSSIINSKLYGK